MQRWVIVALGRPVVVLRGYADPLGAFVVGCSVLGGRLLLGGVEWAGERCRDVHVIIIVLCCDQTLV